MMRWAKAEGWSQSDLANRIGVSPQNITNWKVRGVPPERHAEIAALFSRTVEQLLGREDEKAAQVRNWPYPMLDERKFCGLAREDALRLESIILLGAAQLGLDIKK